MKFLISFSVLISCLFLALFAAAQGSSRASRRNGKPAPGPATAQVQEGEQVFRANCARCHNAPEELSPRVVPAVLRQMRTRAMLNPRQVRQLLKFLAP